MALLECLTESFHETPFEGFPDFSRNIEEQSLKIFKKYFTNIFKIGAYSDF
jgi:hypothetical protein